MSGTPDLGATELQRLDELCNRYEADWMSGKTPRTEDFLGDATEPFRSALLSELLRLEFHYRADCTLEELQKRFPEVAATVLVDAAHEAKANVPAAGRLPGIPGYQILGVLGRGGMGIVYEARDLELDRRVALKMLHATHHAPSFRTRFAGEARSAARLHHPHLVQIFDVGEANGQPYLVFELMEGGTLSQRLGGQPLVAREAARLLEPLARAVQLAHDNGVVHRDLKPSNVLMAKDHQSAKISDFGLAKRLDDDSNQTQSGMMMGTPAYMAPEQADPSRSGVGPASDIYSLGAILYEMLTGQPPYRAASLIETLEQLRTREPVPPRAINPKIPRARPRDNLPQVPAKGTAPPVYVGGAAGRRTGSFSTERANPRPSGRMGGTDPPILPATPGDRLSGRDLRAGPRDQFYCGVFPVARCRGTAATG
ncbi:MAG: serine/threonine-protein kinase [Planctomycetota bacterium]|nr:serine/threonine-protein kinase [Planctomycetota bacterium]